MRVGAIDNALAGRRCESKVPELAAARDERALAVYNGRKKHAYFPSSDSSPSFPLTTRLPFPLSRYLRAITVSLFGDVFNRSLNLCCGVFLVAANVARLFT